MPETTDLVARFSADLTGIQDGVAEVTRDLQEKVAKPIEKTNQKMAASAEKTRAAMGLISRAMSAIGGTAGAVGDQIAKFASAAINSLGLVVDAVKLLAANWKATLVGALIAAGTALVVWLMRSKEANAELREQKKSLEALTAAVKKSNESWKAAQDAQIASMKAIREATIRAIEFNEQAELYAAKALAAKKAIVDWTVAMQEARKAQLAMDDVIARAAEAGFADPENDPEQRHINKLYAQQAAFGKQAGQARKAIEEQRAELKRVTDEWLSYQSGQKTVENAIGNTTDALANATMAAVKYGVATGVSISASAKAQNELNLRTAEYEVLLENLRADPYWDLHNEQLAQAKSSFESWTASLQLNLADMYGAVMMVGNGISQGIGQAFAQCIVYGEEWGETFKQLGLELAASLISMFAQLLIQQLMYMVMSAIFGTSRASTMIAGYAAEAYAATFAAAVGPFTAMMLWGGPAAAAGLAALSSGLLTGGALAAAGTAKGASQGALTGLAALASGAIVQGPMLALVGEGGEDELIAPRSDYEKLFNQAGGDLTVNLIADGRRLAEVVVPNMPRYLRRRGVRGI